MHYLKKTTKDNFTISPQVIEYRDSNNKAVAEYCPYVPGLVFWLDGIYKGATNNVWTDLINEVQFTNYSSSKPVTINDNHVYFQSGSSMTSTAALNFPFNTRTLEIVYEKSNSVAATLFVPKTSNTVSFGIYNSSTAIVKTGSGGLTLNGTTINAGIHTLSIVYNGPVIHNGTNNVAWNSSSSTNAWTVDSSGNSVLGMRPGQANYPFTGKIYSIRIYNRLLSADEMIYNQSVDNIRFNLGMTLTNSPYYTRVMKSQPNNGLSGKEDLGIGDQIPIIDEPGKEIIKP